MAGRSRSQVEPHSLSARETVPGGAARRWATSSSTPPAIHDARLAPVGGSPSRRTSSSREGIAAVHLVKPRQRSCGVDGQRRASGQAKPAAAEYGRPKARPPKRGELDRHHIWPPTSVLFSSCTTHRRTPRPDRKLLACVTSIVALEFLTDSAARTSITETWPVWTSGESHLGKERQKHGR
jgi:hypothetical protein